ncbi:site-2 protease family protein [Breznakia pachnodae]|uniref:Peptidase M41 domain-containing protein n=1 Tax=Breznakia pachnodae TaxID=265178 RepID=A0ABU0E760_9FIRM|nr:site-2 protease family protein [Breznakia pachnodae]MDQ0362556.1 hypothetical protein [Breznakia pachnodae]
MKEKMLLVWNYLVKRIVIISGILLVAIQAGFKLDRQTVQILLVFIGVMENVVRMFRYSLLDNEENMMEKFLYTTIFIMTYSSSDLDIGMVDYITNCIINCFLQSTGLLIMVYMVVYASKVGEKLLGVTLSSGRDYKQQKTTELTGVGKLRKKYDNEHADDHYIAAMDDLIAEEVAFHEAGHAIVARMCGFKVNYISIIKNLENDLGGYVTIDSQHFTSLLFLSNDYIRKRAMMSYGGPAADQVFKKITNIKFGADFDIENATQNLKTYWRNEYLMNHSFTPVKLEVFDTEHQKLLIQEIDEKVKQDSKVCFEQAKQIVEENIELVVALVDLLIEKKEVNQNEVAKFFNDYYKERTRGKKDERVV